MSMEGVNLNANRLVGQKLAVAVTMGDQLGIGPEITVKALTTWVGRHECDVYIHGGEEVLLAAANAAGVSPFWLKATHVGGSDRNAVGCYSVVGGMVLGAPSSELNDARQQIEANAGERSFAAVLGAIEQAKAGLVQAIVTGPISKLGWALAGHSEYPGHTELLGEHLGRGRAEDTVMFFSGPRIKLVLATVHVPLADVPRILTTERIVRAAELGVQACRAQGVAHVRVAVCGLNPHAGEEGLLGEEDARVIAPAVVLLRARGVDAFGPLSADSVFLKAAGLAKAGRDAGCFDLFVAMYHDQGLIPVKLLDRELSVNVTLGLRDGVVRTSPAHGTARDIAGKNIADPGSMLAALDLALALAKQQRALRLA